MPDVSVVIPTYNRTALLKRSIQSVLNQSYQDFEIIVVDDASTEDIRAVVRYFEDKRITYLRRDKNGGEAAARNTGIAHATGKFIASHDSDDEWMPEKLAKQMGLFQDSSEAVGVVYTGFWRAEGEMKKYFPSSMVKKTDGDIHEEILKGNFVGTPTTLVKKECFEKAGLFDEKLFHLVDWEMWIRISALYHFRCVHEPLVATYDMSDSVSRNQMALVAGHEYILTKHFGDFGKSRSVLAGELYWIGNLWCQIGNKERGREYFKRALSAMPLNPKYLGAFLLSYASYESYSRLVALKQKLLDTRNPR
jgi:glycosyltransferase involved in cell wall biosynthesis